MSVANIKRRNNLSLFAKTLTASTLNIANLNIDQLTVDDLNAETVTASSSIDAAEYTSTYNNIVVKNVNLVWQKSLQHYSTPILTLGQFTSLSNFDSSYTGSSIQNCEIGNIYILKCSYQIAITGGVYASLQIRFNLGSTTINGYVENVNTSTSPYKGEFEMEISIQSYNSTTGAIGLGYVYKNQYVSTSDENVKNYYITCATVATGADAAKVNRVLPFNYGFVLSGAGGSPDVIITRNLSILKQFG